MQLQNIRFKDLKTRAVVRHAAHAKIGPSAHKNYHPTDDASNHLKALASAIFEIQDPECTHHAHCVTSLPENQHAMAEDGLCLHVGVARWEGRLRRNSCVLAATQKKTTRRRTALNQRRETAVAARLPPAEGVPSAKDSENLERTEHDDGNKNAPNGTVQHLVLGLEKTKPLKKGTAKRY